MARSSSAPAACPTCAAPLVEIRLGVELTLRSCSNCDSRWWSRADQPADLDQVLRVVTATDGRRQPVSAAR